MTIRVQQATMNALDRLYEIERECFTTEAFSREQIADLLLHPNSVGLVAMIDGKVAGFIIGLLGQDKRETHVGHVYTLDVATRHRRRGVGSRLLEELERIFIQKGVKTCYLEARLGNVTARELYSKHGYLEMETLEDYYQKGIHAVRLKKML